MQSSSLTKQPAARRRAERGQQINLSGRGTGGTDRAPRPRVKALALCLHVSINRVNESARENVVRCAPRHSACVDTERRTKSPGIPRKQPR